VTATCARASQYDSPPGTSLACRLTTAISRLGANLIDNALRTARRRSRSQPATRFRGRHRGVDRGVGIPPIKWKIEEPFTRATEARARADGAAAPASVLPSSMHRAAHGGKFEVLRVQAGHDRRVTLPLAGR